MCFCDSRLFYNANLAQYFVIVLTAGNVFCFFSDYGMRPIYRL